MIRLCLGIFFFLYSFVFANSKSDTLQSSLLEVKVTTQAPNFQFPWIIKKPILQEGVGVYVGKEQILVLANLIEYATSIEVIKYSSNISEPAKLQKIDFEANLAILTVNNKKFFQDLKPAKFEDKVKLDTEVTICQLDQTQTLQTAKARISGMDMDQYPLSHIELPYLNIVSNEKLEGKGEIISLDGKIFGIVYKFLSNKNLARGIPSFIVNQFLEYEQKGSAFPFMGFQYRPVIDQATKDYYGLKKEGVLVTEIIPYSGAEKVLQLEDIILEAGEFTLDALGRFQHPDLEYGKQALSFLLHSGKEIGYTKGDKIKLKILRNQKEMTVNLPLKAFPYKAIAIPYGHNFGKNPEYTILGGFIFTELSEFLLKEWGTNWRSRVDKKLLYLLDYKKFHEPKQSGKILVLVQVLPDDSNNGYHNLSMEILKSVNGKTVKSIKELEKIIFQSKEDFAALELENEITIAIELKNLSQINERISQKFNIPKLSSRR